MVIASVSLAPAPVIAGADSAAMLPRVPFAKAPVAREVIDTTSGVDFAQNHSDLLPDPAVRFGKLANGMTYMIARNKTPPGKGTVRLRIAAGSLMESDRQRGLAHFLEHMAFKGSKNVPENEMIRILERHGLSFGADTNAYTTFGETAYILEIPKVSEETVDTVLFLLREVAGNLAIAPEAIERERGVILGEERVRNSPQSAMGEYIARKSFAGHKLPDRIPIGTIPVITGAQREEFVDFYNAFYRPELATLIVAGDIDPDAIEKKIQAKFGDWTPAVPGPIRKTELGGYTNKGLQADTYTDHGLPNSISMVWSRPVDEHYQTVDKGYQDLQSALALGIMNERLNRLALRGEAAYRAAGVGRGALSTASDSVTLAISPKPDQDKAALMQAYTVLRQFALYGADQAELDRALVNLEAQYKAGVEGAETRHTGGIAGTMLSSIGAGLVVTSPTQAYELFESLRPRLTLARINEAAKALIEGDGPYLWHTGEDLKGFGKNELLAGYRAVQDARIDAPKNSETKAWPYTEFPGTAAPIVNRRTIAQTGATELTYANGVGVIIKSTPYDKNSISVNVRFAGGLKSVPPSQDSPIFEARNIGVINGGLGKLDGIDIGDSLAGKVLGINFGIGDEASALGAGGVPSDLPTMMQIMMAYMADAAYRPQPFDQYRQSYKESFTASSTTPGGVFEQHFDAIVHANDPRFGNPTPEQVDRMSVDKGRAFIERQFKTAPIEILVVGDINEKDVEAEIARTFAKLSPRSVQPSSPAAANVVKFPTQNLKQSFLHEGRADQSIGYIAWPTTDLYANPQDSAGLKLLSDVIGLRLIAQVRQEKALTYSPNSGWYMSESFKDFGYITARAEVRPEKLDTFYDIVHTIVEDLKTKPVSEDELLRVRQPALDRLVNADHNNGYWVSALSGLASEPRRLDYLQGRRDRYAAVTPADLQRLAKQYLVNAKALKIDVRPAAGGAARAAPQ